MSTTKKLLSLFLTLVTACCLILLYGCSEKDNNIEDNYKVEMGLSIRTTWPEQKTLYYATRLSGASQSPDPILTEENNELSLDVEGCPLISISIHFYIMRGDSWIETIDVPEEHLLHGGQYYYEYARKNKNGRWATLNLAHTLYDDPRPDSFSLSLRTNNYELQRLPGEHRIIFSYPFDKRYNIEKKFFTVYLNVKGDERKYATIKPADSDAYTKYQADGRDIFFMKNPITDGVPDLPQFGVYDGNTTVLAPTDPLDWFNESTVPHIKSWFVKTGESFMIDYPPRSILPREPGVYLASFTYTGNEIYQPVEYVCYIIIP